MRLRAALTGVLLLFLHAAVPPCSLADRAVVDWEFEYVNVRASASTAGEPVGRLATGAEAEVLETRGEWSRVGFPGGEGWVVSRSLRELPPPVADPSPVDSAPPQPSTPSRPVESPAPAPPSTAPSAQEPGRASEVGDDEGGYLSRYTQTPDAPEFDTGPSVVSAISGLVIVLALIAGTVWVVRKLLGSRFPSARRPGGVRVLASRPVAPRQSLLLVEVEGLVWLVGQGPEGTRLIDRIEDPRALERLDDRYEFLETPFQSELRRTLDLEGETGSESGEPQAEGDEPTREQRLAALRRRGKPTDGT